MRPITARRLIKILADNGFILIRQKGSHCIYRHAISGIIVPVPMHGRSRPINIVTFLAIVEQSKIPKEKFN